MATVEKYVPPVPAPVYKIELSATEAKNLYSLLVDGVDSKVNTRLGLTTLISELRLSGIREDNSLSFDYLAELG